MIRRVLLAVGLLALVFHAPIKGADPDVVLDNDPKQALSELEGCLEEPDKAERGAKLLQRLLDQTPPCYVLQARGKGAPRVEIGSFAERLVRAEHGPVYNNYRYYLEAAAKTALEAARDNPTKLQAVVRRFGLTGHGEKAARRLAEMHYGNGNWSQAAAYWARVGVNVDWPADELVFATRAFRLSGDVENGRKAWEVLKKGEIDGAIKVGSSQVKVADLWKRIEKEAPLPGPGQHTPMFRVGATRNGLTPDREVSLTLLWDKTLPREKETRAAFEKGLDAYTHNKQGLVSGAVPLVLKSPNAAHPHDVVVYRSSWGVEAHRLDSDDLVWEADNQYSLDKIERQGRFASELDHWVEKVWGKLDRQDVLLGPSTLGTMSSDGKRLFLVADWGFPFYHRPDQKEPPPFRGRLAEGVLRNYLQAFDIEEGKLLWELGGDEPTADSFFLGAPLPLGDRLYVLYQQDKQLRVLELEAKTGRLVQAIPLAQMAESVGRNMNRRTTAAHLAYADGMLICPTHAGVVFAVDLACGRPVWAHAYRESSSVDAPLAFAGSTPIIADGKLVLAPADDPNIHVLDLKTGVRLWKQEPLVRGLYVAGVKDGEVLVACRDYFQAMRLSDGTRAWLVDTARPSGLGVLGEKYYYLPVHDLGKDKPGVTVIDLGKHKVDRHIPTEKGETLGNIVLCGDHLVSQSPLKIAVYGPKR